MKKKAARKASSVRVRSAHPAQKRQVFFLVKSWMFVVMFALMLGVGAIVGTYINQEMNMATPQVAGVQIEVK